MGKFAALPYVFQPGETSLRKAPIILGFVPAFRYLVTDADYDEAMSDLDSVSMVSFDTETTSLYVDDLIMVSFSFAYGNKNWVCLVSHEEEAMCFTDYGRLQALVWKILTRPVPFLFNARFDLRVVGKALGIDIFSINPVDVQSLVFIADSNWKMPGLKECERFFLGYDPPDIDPQWLGLNMQHAPLDKFGEYSAYDSYGTLKLGELLYPEIMKRYDFIAKLDRKLIPALMSFEDSVFDIDRQHLVTVQEEVSKRTSELVEMIYGATGPFLLTSNVQLAAKLVSLGYSTGGLTNGGSMSVSIDNLRNIEGVDFVSWLIEYKKLMKLNSSYLCTMIRRCDLGLPFRFHYTLNNAPTMRLSAGAYSRERKKALQQTHYFVDINFQSFSKPEAVSRRVDWDPDTFEINFHDEGKYLVESGKPTVNLRKAFIVPDDSFVYTAIDYAGQELKIAASLSGEKVWIDAFMNGKDVHKQTAISIWGEKAYNKNRRKMAKIANFGVLYGGGTYFLMTKLKMTKQEAEDFIKAYREALPDLFSWTDRIHSIARRQGYIISEYKLPRRLSFYYRQGGGMAGYADRSAVNTLVQGSAGVIIRIALTRLFAKIGPTLADGIVRDFHGDVLFRGTVHDELDFCIRKSRFREFIGEVVPLMTKTIPKAWVVPMEVEVSVGNNWGEMFAIDHNHPDLLPKEVELAKDAGPDEGDWSDGLFSYDEDDDVDGEAVLRSVG